jgi:N-acetylmuramate 1-kinase
MTTGQPFSNEIFGFLKAQLPAGPIDVQPLAGDASSRRYYRIVSGAGGGAAESTRVLMVWEPFIDDGRFPFLNVQRHFAAHGVRVPAVEAYDSQLGVILLQDLGDLTLERKFWENQNQSLAIPYYQQAIDELFKIHFDATADRASNCVSFGVEFNVEKLMWELNYGREHVFEKLCRLPMSVAVSSALTKEFQDICETLHTEPKVICHRDYHSRNLMLLRGRVHVIDFQDARMGTAQYDLVSLLYDSYVNMDDAVRATLLDYYFSKASLGSASREHFDLVMKYQILQRCFKACGSFASFFNMREDLRYLKYLSPTLKQVAQTLRDFSQYPTFAGLLNDHGLLEHDFSATPRPEF